jgi:hypothetical protein
VSALDCSRNSICQAAMAGFAGGGLGVHAFARSRRLNASVPAERRYIRLRVTDAAGSHQPVPHATGGTREDRRVRPQSLPAAEDRHEDDRHDHHSPERTIMTFDRQQLDAMDRFDTGRFGGIRAARLATSVTVSAVAAPSAHPAITSLGKWTPSTSRLAPIARDNNPAVPTTAERMMVRRNTNTATTSASVT